MGGPRLSGALPWVALFQHLLRAACPVVSDGFADLGIFVSEDFSGQQCRIGSPRHCRWRVSRPGCPPAFARSTVASPGRPVPRPSSARPEPERPSSQPSSPRGGPAPPAAVIITSRPRSSAVEAYSMQRSGVRWPEITWTSWAMPSASSVSEERRTVSQSDLDPMTTPTSGRGSFMARACTSSPTGSRVGLGEAPENAPMGHEKRNACSPRPDNYIFDVQTHSNSPRKVSWIVRS